MKVYVVIADNDFIYSVRKNKKRAEEDKAHLESVYGCNPTIEEHLVD